MCEVGVNTKAVQEIFEYAHAETTMKIYAEATKDLRKSELINFLSVFKSNVKWKLTFKFWNRKGER